MTLLARSQLLRLSLFIAVAVCISILYFVAFDVPSASAAPALTATSTTVTSNNASTTLAKVGNTVTFYIGLSGTPWAAGSSTINIFNMGSTTMTSVSGAPGASWTYSTTSASSWTEGAIQFKISFGNTDGTATTTITQADLSSSNVVFDMTSPIGYSITTGATVNRAASTSASFTFAAATVGNTYLYHAGDGSATTTGTGTIVTATDVISSVNMSSLANGTITFDVSLADPAGNRGATTTTTTTLDTGIPSTPTVDVAVGKHSEAQTVTVSSTGSTVVRWTTDGTSPTCTVGSTGAIEVELSTTINAIGCDAALNSASASFTYTIELTRTSGGGGSSNSSSASASTQSSNTSSSKPMTIAELEIEIARLTTLIASIKSGAVPASTGSFMRDLTIGATGEDVRALQAWLNAHGFALALTGVGSAGKETMLFGALTRAALAKLQASVSIIPSVGYFGPKTRAYISTH